MHPLAFVTMLLPVFCAFSARADSIFVASPRGVRQVSLDGKTVRWVSREPARRPRLLPDQKSLLFLVPKTGQLRRLDLQTGMTAAVATLPRRFRLCARPQDGGQLRYPLDQLDVQSVDDFVIDASGQAACLTLMDRNINMANVIIDVRVSLQGSGQVDWALDFPNDCPGKKTAPCERKSLPYRQPPNAAYDMEEGWLVGGKRPRIRLGQGDFSVDAVSPGGTWAVIGGDIDEGDYIHRSLFLLQRQTGSVHTIAEKSITLRRAQLRTMAVESEAAVGETEIRWLSDSALLIDQKLVWPGVGLVDLGGEVAASP